MSEQEQKPKKESKQKASSAKSEKEENSAPKYTGYDLDYFISPRDIGKAVRKMDESAYFLEDIACLDIEEGFELVYHFDRYHQPGRVGLRVLVPKENPQVPTISSIYPGADWHERECYDFFGIEFKDHPNLIHLLLDAEFEEPPPLLKEESSRRELQQICPDREYTPISVESDDFIQAIRNCSKAKSRDET